VIYSTELLLYYVYAAEDDTTKTNGYSKAEQITIVRLCIEKIELMTRRNSWFMWRLMLQQ